MHSLVSLDLETTGLDPRKDEIIEIGAVRFNGSRVEAEFQTLVNPGRPIPPEIIRLTGISNEMVCNAPPLQAVLAQLVDFVGDSPVVGHNVQFDLGFLIHANVLQYVQTIDTYELAATVMPLASRYNLGGLCQQLSIPLQNAHRALNDARMTHHLYLNLYEKVKELPIDLIAEIVKLGESVDWDAFWVFQQILKEKIRQGPLQSKKAGLSQLLGGLFTQTDILAPALKPNPQIVPLDADEVSAILEPGGAFASFFKQYEYRSQQVEMLRNVVQAFSDGYHLMVEAGTGIGKSFAYLVPAVFWSLQNNERVVVSTNTIALQEQLIQKDLPDLKAALGLDFRSTVLKGRSNYLCPRRFEALRHRGPESKEEMRVIAKVLVWLSQNGDGDRSRLNLNSPLEREVWSRISADDEACNAEVCLSRMGGVCPFYQARQFAQSAHIVVVNHALLLSDVVTGSRVLPPYNYLIVDEGHHLEDASTSTLSFRLTQNDLARMLRELGSISSGILARVLTSLRKSAKPSVVAASHEISQRITDLAFRLEQDLNTFFALIEEFLESERNYQPVGVYSQQVRILPATRTVPAWSSVEIQYDNTHETMTLLLKLIKEYHRDLTDYLEVASEDLEEAVFSLGTNIQRLSEAGMQLNNMFLEPDSNFIYWIEKQPESNRLTLQIAPLHVGSLMEKYLWHEKKSIILTSATLTAHGEFDYLRNRLNAFEADDLVVGSPFDYENAALLYLPNDIPEPTRGYEYQKAVEQTIVRLSKATGGKMLALFTSYAQLKKTSQAIASPLISADIQVFEQGEGASANTLLETFRDSDRAVLLGTRAFWEGVDIPGDALSVVVIVKLPFAVPSDPIVAARSETFEDPFSEYSVPEAILTFRQGFGRLIRTQSDRGVVVVLDRRISSKRYGKLFIESLPDCQVAMGPVLDLPQRAARWLNL